VSFSLSKSIIKYFRRKKYGRISPQQELSDLEKKILEEISVGKSYQTIADELSITSDNVQKHIRIIYEKLQHKSVSNEQSIF
jgi:NarL family two-component system response regulator LiaR